MPEPEGVTFPQCALCFELKLTSTLYCSPECQKNHWPEHKVWHQKQKEHAKGKPGPERKQRPQLVLPPRKKWAMDPFRRLHKMCVGKKRGKRLARRSALATDDAVQRAHAWIKDPSAQSNRARALIARKAWQSKNGRRKLAKTMKRVCGLGLQGALGVITKLKQRKLLD